MRAYVLIQTEANAEPIARTLTAIPGVLTAEDLWGPYDAVALVRYGSGGLALEPILAEMRDLPGVLRVVAAPLIDSEADPRTGQAA